MNSLMTEDQIALEESCRHLLSREWPLQAALKAFGASGRGHDTTLWRIIADTGWLSLPFDTAVGGGGGDLVDLGLVYRAAGERLVPASFYAAVFSALVIDRIALDNHKRTLLPTLLAGDRLIVTAYMEKQALDDPRFIDAYARPVENGWVLSGHKRFVPYLDIAQDVLVLMRTRSNTDRAGWGLFRIDTAELAGRYRQSSMMGSERFFDLSLDGLQVADDAALCTRGDLLPVFDDVVQSATALQCMEMVGGVQAVMNMTVAYVAQREQGGRVIGAYQAVQHLLANVAIQLNGARIAALKALFETSHGRPAARDVAIAKIACGECYTAATVAAHQVWGAMGYARETGLYLYSERARTTDASLGSRPYQLRRLADQMCL
jgi:alkylation response protein AidB-like acyl-CoA dehydrogenase